MSLDILTGVSHSLAPLTKFYSTWLWKQTVVSSNESELCRYYLHFLNLLRILNTIFLSGRENNYIQVKIKSKQNSQKVQKCLSENMSWILLRIFECRLASKKDISAEIWKKHSQGSENIKYKSTTVGTFKHIAESARMH